MFSKHSHKENAELTERFSISENVRLIQDLPGVHRLVKLTVNEGFLAVVATTLAPLPTFSVSYFGNRYFAMTCFITDCFTTILVNGKLRKYCLCACEADSDSLLIIS